MNTIPKPVKINDKTYALFGAYGIDTIHLEASAVWVVNYQNTPSKSIEPRYARAFLDSIGLQDEPRIGEQDEWDDVLGNYERTDYTQQQIVTTIFHDNGRKIADVTDDGHILWDKDWVQKPYESGESANDTP